MALGLRVLGVYVGLFLGWLRVRGVGVGGSVQVWGLRASSFTAEADFGALNCQQTSPMQACRSTAQ